MKQCPNCGELIGDNANECFKCHYNYSYGRVVTSREDRNEFEAIKQQEQKEGKAHYEYKVEVINDCSTGEINAAELQRLLAEYSLRGWRLHSVFTNEVGKNSGGVAVSFLGLSVNATIDQTILIFERCIKALETC